MAQMTYATWDGPGPGHRLPTVSRPRRLPRVVSQDERSRSAGGAGPSPGRPGTPGDGRRESPSAPAPDELARLQAGDPRAIEAACAKALPTIRRLLFRLLGPRPEVDDATQDALLAFARALPRFEGRSSLATLAHRITVRVAYRYFRGGRPPELALSLVAPAPDEVDPESVAASRETLRRLYRCLERLPEKRRVAFVLCCVEGMTPTDAAELEGTSAVTMRSRLMRARQEVARLMKGDPFVQAILTPEVAS